MPQSHVALQVADFTAASPPQPSPPAPAAVAFADVPRGTATDQEADVHKEPRHFSVCVQQQIAALHLDECAALRLQLEYLQDVNQKLAEAAAAKDYIIADKESEVAALREQVRQLERIVDLGADRLHFLEDQRNASLALVRKVFADGRQLELARQRLLEFLLDENVPQEFAGCIRQALLSAKSGEAFEVVRTVERSLFQHGCNESPRVDSGKELELDWDTAGLQVETISSNIEGKCNQECAHESRCPDTPAARLDISGETCHVVDEIGSERKTLHHPFVVNKQDQDEACSVSSSTEFSGADTCRSHGDSVGETGEALLKAGELNTFDNFGEFRELTGMMKAHHVKSGLPQIPPLTPHTTPVKVTAPSSYGRLRTTWTESTLPLALVALSQSGAVYVEKMSPLELPGTEFIHQQEPSIDLKQSQLTEGKLGSCVEAFEFETGKTLQF